jgi:hypothetical protein
LTGVESGQAFEKLLCIGRFLECLRKIVGDGWAFHFRCFDGALEPVTQRKSYMCYEADSTAPTGVRARRDVGADFGSGHLNVYKTCTQGNFPIPIGRSGAPVTGAGPVVAVNVRGSAGGAPLPLQTRRENMLRVITHELGHGLAEAAHTIDPDVFEKYRLAAGWTKGRSPQLLDSGVPAVQTALANDTTPPSQYEITADNWNQPRWVEQAISLYMVSKPGEDFAEAVMTYINARDVLRSRAARRFNFLESNKHSWQRALLRAYPVGDFPDPSRERREA